MRYLRRGLKGDDVQAWKIFLRGINPYSDIVVDDSFDDQTHEETREFQAQVGLNPIDGVVGKDTLAEALKLGFNPMIDDRVDVGPNWPAPPAGFSFLSSTERAQVFGTFKHVPAPTQGNPEGIRIVDDWVKNNIVSVVVPQLIGVIGAPKDGKILFHKKATNQLLSMFAAWEAAGLKDRILTYAGSWVPRYIRGSRSVLSNHAWGTAFDINAAWNMLGTTPALKGQKGSVRELVGIAYEHGFAWGGHFGYGQIGTKRSDGMHFEVARVI